jgi:phage FluMu protein Com/uncharacterized protein YbaR (Trm112 family)
MPTVRCLSCQRVFSSSATSKHTNVQCPECGAVHPLGSLPTSTAGDSMLISPGALKQILETPKGPEAARAHVRSEPVIFCPSCKVRLYVDRRKYGGKRVNCPECRKPMIVPRASQDVSEVETAPEG